jgi:hypothetical protein
MRGEKRREAKEVLERKIKQSMAAVMGGAKPELNMRTYILRQITVTK